MNISPYLHSLYQNKTAYAIIVLSTYSLSDFIPVSYYSIIFAMQSILYFGAFLFWYMDTHHGWWSKYKRDIHQPSDTTFIQMLPRVLFNNVASYFIYTKILLTISNDRGLVDDNPSFLKMVMDLILVFYTFDFLFYFSHRLIHLPPFYKYIHKLHHTTHGDNAISVHYMTLPDFLMEVIIPYWIAITLWNCSFISSLIFAILAQINGIITHSGYNFVGFMNPYVHQDHHLYFNKNFGVGGPWDDILQTRRIENLGSN